MKEFIIAAVAVLLSAASVSAQVTVDTSAIAAAKKHRGAPGPILGVGLPALAAGGIGYGICRLVRRRRRTS
jgi:hypothetical protein